jgi:hypothetical protein
VTDQPRITTTPAKPDEALIHLPEFTYWDTQVWACDIGVPVELLPGLRDAIDKHLGAPSCSAAAPETEPNNPAPACGEECAEGHTYAGRCTQADPLPVSTCPRTDRHGYHMWPDQPGPAFCPGHPAPVSFTDAAETATEEEANGPDPEEPDHAYRNKVNAVIRPETIAALKAQLAAGTVPTRTVKPRPAWTAEQHVGHGSPCEYRPDGSCANPARTAPDNPAASNNETTCGYVKPHLPHQYMRLEVIGECRGVEAADDGPRLALNRIISDRAHHEHCANLAHTDEGGIAHSSIAAGLQIAETHLRAALDGPADTTPPATLPGHATVTIRIQAPDQDNADRWAGTIRDLVQAEHGHHMRLNIRIATPPADLPGCTATLRLGDTLIHCTRHAHSGAHSDRIHTWYDTAPGATPHCPDGELAR